MISVTYNCKMFLSLFCCACYGVFVMVCLLCCVCYGVFVMVCLLWCVCYGVFVMVCLLWCVCYGVLVMLCLLCCVCYVVFVMLCLLCCVCCSLKSHIKQVLILIKTRLHYIITFVSSFTISRYRRARARGVLIVKKLNKCILRILVSYLFLDRQHPVWYFNN